MTSIPVLRTLGEQKRSELQTKYDMRGNYHQVPGLAILTSGSDIEGSSVTKGGRRTSAPVGTDQLFLLTSHLFIRDSLLFFLIVFVRLALFLGRFLPDGFRRFVAHIRTFMFWFVLMCPGGSGSPQVAEFYSTKGDCKCQILKFQPFRYCLKCP